MNLNLLSDCHERYLHLIDWPAITASLASNAYFNSTRKDIQSKPNNRLNLDQIKNLHDSFETILKKINDDLFPELYEQFNYLPSETDFNLLNKKNEKEAIFDLKEINAFLIFLESYSISQNVFDKDDFLHDFYLKTKNSFLIPLRRFLLKTGRIDYSAHPKLRSLQQIISEYDQTAKKTISELLNKYKNQIQIDTYDIFNDHYILMFKTDQYQHKFGFIHARSESGQTLYVEPPELTQLSQKRKSASLEMEKIIYEMSMKYSQYIHSFKKEFKALFSHLLRIDKMYSLSRYFYLKNFTKPDIQKGNNIFIKGFFHPSIENPVKNDIKFTGEHGLIISGPNTGGKSVALKSICLCMVFGSLGYYVPAEEASFFPADQIYFLAQDHQNIQEGLSSFSAESLHYIELLKQIKKNAVIFIDEIFNSTSSEEASAIALGLFEYLADNFSPYVFVSTHHQMLKVMTHQSQMFSAYHVGFDQKTLKPDFKIYPDGPGSSQALEIFQQMGANLEATQEIIQIGKKVLDSKHIEYESLLNDVAKKNSELSVALEKQKNINAQLENQYKSQEGILKLKMAEKMQKAEVKVKKLQDKASRLLEEVKEGKLTTQKNLEKNFFEIRDQLIDKSPKSGEQSYSNNVTEPIIGEKYIYIPMRRIGTAIKVDRLRKKVTLDLNGKFKIDAKFQDLAIGPNTKKTNLDNKFQFNIRKETKDSIVLDARGMRLDEFKNEVDRSLSGLYSGSIPYLEIIHGHGNGILKNWLRNFLKKKDDLIIEFPKKSLDGTTLLRLEE